MTGNPSREVGSKARKGGSREAHLYQAGDYNGETELHSTGGLGDSRSPWASLSYPQGKQLGYLLTNLPPQLQRGPEKRGEPSLLQHFLPVGGGSRLQPRGNASGFGSRAGTALCGKIRGDLAGNPPVRAQMGWPSQRAQDPDVGRGNWDGGKGESPEAFR